MNVKYHILIAVLMIIEHFAVTTQVDNLSFQPLFNLKDGEAVPPGFYPFLVVFVKKPDLNSHSLKFVPKIPQDFSTKNFICSGSIVNTRWIITTATPIAYYPIGSYWVVAQQSLKDKVELLRHRETDFILIHPDHTSGERETDLALVRAAKSIEFNLYTKNANMGFGNFREYSSCKLIVWSWFTNEIIEKSEINFTPLDEQCLKDTNSDKNFICTPIQGYKLPCAVNTGAPVLCDSVLVGLYVGAGFGAVCGAINAFSPYKAIRIDYGRTSRWIESVLSNELFVLKTQIIEYEDNLILKKC